MSVEFQRRRISEYARIVQKRKWLIILPTIAIGLAIAYAVFRLPDIYESATLIVVKPSTLPNTVMPAINEETLTRELTSISQVMTSRSSLQPLVEKYDLYGDERQRGEPMEVIIDQMRKSIKVEVNTNRKEITSGFNITYHGRDPKSTKAVAAELASRYIAELDARISANPNAEVGLEAPDREYQTKKSNYDDLLVQQQKVDLGADAANQQEGGGIQLIDPANLPERPIAPKRVRLTIAGFGLGLALSLFLAGILEIRRLFTIQAVDDAKHYTSLPVLVAIPQLLTQAEARAIPRRHKMAMAAGIAAAFVSIPTLAFVLRLTQVFERFLH